MTFLCVKYLLETKRLLSLLPGCVLVGGSSIVCPCTIACVGSALGDINRFSELWAATSSEDWFLCFVSFISAILPGSSCQPLAHGAIGSRPLLSLYFWLIWALSGCIFQRSTVFAVHMAPSSFSHCVIPEWRRYQWSCWSVAACLSWKTNTEGFLSCFLNMSLSCLDIHQFT